MKSLEEEEWETYQENILDEIVYFFEKDCCMKKIMSAAEKITEDRRSGTECGFEACIYPLLYEYLKGKIGSAEISVSEEEKDRKRFDFEIKSKSMEIEIFLEFKIIAHDGFERCKEDFGKIKEEAKNTVNNRRGFFVVVIGYPHEAKNNFWDEYKRIKNYMDPASNKIDPDFPLKRYKRFGNGFRIYIFKYTGEVPYIKRAVLKCLDDKVSEYEAFIFGSRAVQKAKIQSDWDIALQNKRGENVPFEIISRIWNELDEMFISADIVDLSNVSTEFRKCIQKDIIWITDK